MSLVLTSEEQRLADWARDSLPAWFCNSGEDSPELQVFAKQFMRVLLVAQFWNDMSFIGRAVQDGDGIDWLDGLARDLGIRRITGESDTSLRYRMRNIQPAITKAAIEDSANSLLASLGIAGTVVIEELPRDGAYCETTPGSPGDAASYGFCRTPAVDALSQRCAKAYGGTIIVILPFGISDVVRLAVLGLIRKLKAAGMQAVVEVKGA